MNKELITRSKGSKLGVMGEAWVDPQRMEVVAFEVEDKKNSTVSCLPLYTLKEVGDVALVQDKDALSTTPSIYGCVKLLGMEVRTTRDNRMLGKVRDLSFNPDTGIISKIWYDEFGLRFLPVNLFDTYSIPVDFIEFPPNPQSNVLYVSATEYSTQEQRGALSNLIRSVVSSGGSGGGGALALLPGPSGQSYAADQRWEESIRQWEAQTGWRYEEYMRVKEEEERQRRYGAGGRPALPPARQPQQLPAPAQGVQQGMVPGGAPAPYALPGAAPVATGFTGRGGARPGALPPQQGQQPYGAAPYGGVDPRYRGGSAAGPTTPVMSPAGQQQQPQARYPPATGGQQQQQPQYGQQQYGQQPSPYQPSYRQQQQPLPPQQQPGAPRPTQQQQQPMMQQPGSARVAAAAQGPGGSAVQSAGMQQGGGYVAWPGSPGLSSPGPAGMAQAQPPQQQQQQQQQQGYGGAGSGPQGQVHSPLGAPVNGVAVNGAGGGGGGGDGGSMRVEEWLAREGQGGDPALELTGRFAPPQQQQQL